MADGVRIDRRVRKQRASSLSRTDLLLSDWAGHGFTYELAVALDERGTATTYSYCATTTTPKGQLLDGRCDAIPVGSGKGFDRYNLVRRALSEIRYGLGTARVVWRVRPRNHVVCNMPLVSLLIIWATSLPLRQRPIIWFQDVQSALATQLLHGGAVSRAISALESFLLRRAARVIAISPEIADEALSRNVDVRRVGTLPNWAPIESIPVRPRHNQWSTEHDLDDCITFIYAGTLGRKHDPDVLRHLATVLEPHGASVVVVSEGEGADWLRNLPVAERPTNLVVLPYQPFSSLPDVLGSADVLVTLLEPLAGLLTVPSKTLSYLCAGRPILAAMPFENPAARMIKEVDAGRIVGPQDLDSLAQSALNLIDDAGLRCELGTAGRRYAEQNFTRDVVVEQFLGQLAAAQRRR